MERKTAYVSLRWTPALKAAARRAAAADGRKLAAWIEKLVNAALPKGKKS